MPVTVEKDQERDLTTFKVSGPTDVRELTEAVGELYSNPTRLFLGDFREVDSSDLSSNDVRSVAQAVAKHLPKRPNGKTALVFSGAASFGLGRMFESFTDSQFSNQNPVEFRSFYTLDEGLAWLLSDSDPDQ